MARSTRDLLNVLDTVSKKGAGFRSLADTWADTTTPHGRLMLTVAAHKKCNFLRYIRRELASGATDIRSDVGSQG